MLAGNKLERLPESLSNCKHLELLRIAANRLYELPSWLLSLPRLSWLAYSGNPLGAELESKALTASSIADIRWNNLELEDMLGEGASGVIYRAKYRHYNIDTYHVAVKLFKGAVTSDGLPYCEMAASISAGKHPNLINVIGKVADHPSGANGLVMELIDSEFKNLAAPPSLDSCTRDIYPLDTRFDLATILLIARSISSAALHLHRQGIMHGDLYGHNILHCGQGRALIGDFGAASFYIANYSKIANGLQRLEVRAFGCLLEELMDRCNVRPEDLEVFSFLNELRSACSCEESEQRPFFDEIDHHLIDALRNVNSNGAECERL
jgi:serine/threonine protein kinase